MNEKITLTKVKQMGFSDRLVALLLPEPELVDNPYYKCAPSMKLWKIEDVQEAMKSKEFLEYQEKRKKREIASQKAVRTKKNKLLDMVNQAAEAIKIQVIPFDELVEKTLNAKQRWYDACYDPYYDEYKKEARGADEETINRWVVNYIRHEMTTYDYELLFLARKTGNTEAYMRLFELILNKIAEAYPSLQEECRMQINGKAVETIFY